MQIVRYAEGIAGYAALSSMKLGASRAVLAFHGKGLAAIDADSGELLWDYPRETSYNVNATTPVSIGSQVFITSGTKTGAVLLNVTDSGANAVWQNKAIAAHHTDPYILNGYIYGYSGDSAQNRGAFKCVRLKDGVEQWSTNDMGWGTCMDADGYLICCDIKAICFCSI